MKRYALEDILNIAYPSKKMYDEFGPRKRGCNAKKITIR